MLTRDQRDRVEWIGGLWGDARRRRRMAKLDCGEGKQTTLTFITSSSHHNNPSPSLDWIGSIIGICCLQQQSFIFVSCLGFPSKGPRSREKNCLVLLMCTCTSTALTFNLPPGGSLLNMSGINTVIHINLWPSAMRWRHIYSIYITQQLEITPTWSLFFLFIWVSLVNNYFLTLSSAVQTHLDLVCWQNRHLPHNLG